MTMRVARPGAPSHLRVAGDPATIVTVALVTAVERLMLHDAEIRRGTDDPEAIHDARVAVRQFRSHAASLSSVLDVDAIAPPVEQLGTFARALGAVRDLDVFLEDLAAESADVPEAIRAEAARIASTVADERAIALGRLRRSMDSQEHAQLLMTLMSIAVSSGVVAVSLLATGASLSGLTVIETTAMLLSAVPSLARYVKLSLPLKLAAGT